MRSFLLFTFGLGIVGPLNAANDMFRPDASYRKIFSHKDAASELSLSREVSKRISLVLKNGSDADAAITKLLDDKQAARARQIQIQWLKAYAVFEKDVQPALKLTDQQMGQLKSVQAANAKSHAEMTGFLARARFRSKEARDKYIAGFRDKAHAAIMAVLNKGQAKTLKELGGKKFPK